MVLFPQIAVGTLHITPGRQLDIDLILGMESHLRKIYPQTPFNVLICVRNQTFSLTAIHFSPNRSVNDKICHATLQHGIFINIAWTATKNKRFFQGSFTLEKILQQEVYQVVLRKENSQWNIFRERLSLDTAGTPVPLFS